MCGIAGKLSRGPGPGGAGPGSGPGAAQVGPGGALAGLERLMEAMLDRLTHRGPDARAVHTEAGEAYAVGLAHARLSIIDLSERGRQPMASEDRTVWLVCNGEIYNFAPLRDDLERRGHRFQSRSDSEVILHGYEEWGDGVLNRLEGMFAFAIWDGRRQRLLCARDPAGIKPLYWAAINGQIWFASEIKALLADPTLPRNIDQRGLAHYLAYGHGVAPATMFREIRKLPPGHKLVSEADGRVSVTAYWDLTVGPWRQSTAAGLVDETRQRLTEAVRSHMVADVPVGAFLSGGLDSSGAVALMSTLTGGAPLATFTAGFAEPGYDERDAARAVATHFHTQHHEVEVSPTAFRDALGAVAWHYDEPFADAAAVPLFLLSREASRHIKVVLTGEGSDELFAGYRRVSVERFAGLYGLAPRSVRQFLSGAAHRLPRLRRVKQALAALALDDPAERYASWLTVFDAPMRSRLLAAAAGAEVDVLEPYRQHVHPDLDPVTRALVCDFKTWLPDTYLEKVDKATMAFGLEARVPFLDRQLVEFAFTIPPGLKIRGLDTKHVLKQALSNTLPPATVRRKKRGFAVPLDPWFRGPLRETIATILTDPRTRQRGLVDPEYLKTLAQDHWSGAQVRHAHLYQLLMLELWCRTYLDGDGSKALTL